MAVILEYGMVRFEIPALITSASAVVSYDCGKQKPNTITQIGIAMPYNQ